MITENWKNLTAKTEKKEPITDETKSKKFRDI